MGGARANARLRKQQATHKRIQQAGRCSSVPSLKTLAKRQKAKRDRRKEAHAVTVKDRRLYIGGLHPEITGTVLAKRFDAFGKVTQPPTFPTPKQPTETFAFLDLCAPESDVQRCMRVYNGSVWKGHALQVHPVKQEDVRTRLEKEWAAAARAAIVKRQHEKKHQASAARFMRPFLGNSHLSKRELKRRFPAKSIRKFPFTDYSTLMRGVPSYERFPESHDEVPQEEKEDDASEQVATATSTLLFHQGEKQVFSFDAMEEAPTDTAMEEPIAEAPAGPPTIEEMDIFSVDLLKDSRKPMFFLWQGADVLPDVQRRSLYRHAQVPNVFDHPPPLVDEETWREERRVLTKDFKRKQKVGIKQMQFKKQKEMRHQRHLEKAEKQKEKT